MEFSFVIVTICQQKKKIIFFLLYNHVVNMNAVKKKLFLLLITTTTMIFLFYICFPNVTKSVVNFSVGYFQSHQTFKVTKTFIGQLHRHHRPYLMCFPELKAYFLFCIFLLISNDTDKGVWMSSRRHFSYHFVTDACKTKSNLCVMWCRRRTFSCSDS